MDKKITGKIEYALENIKEAGRNMVQTLGFTAPITTTSATISHNLTPNNNSLNYSKNL